MMEKLPRFWGTLCALCVVGNLASCTAQPVVQTQINPITIPSEYQSCPVLPLPPDPDDPFVTQADVALWATEITAVAEECKYDLDTVMRIIQDYNEVAKSPR